MLPFQIHLISAGFQAQDVSISALDIFYDYLPVGLCRVGRGENYSEISMKKSSSLSTRVQVKPGFKNKCEPAYL